jgi:hypothetical protein
LGNEEIEGREPSEVWQALRVRNTHLGLEELKEYQMFVGQERIQWKDLPRIGMVMVPKVIPVRDRGQNSNWLTKTVFRDREQLALSRKRRANCSRWRKLQLANQSQ